MRLRSIFAIFMLSLSLLGAAVQEPAQGELQYRAVIRFRDAKEPVTTRFTLIPTPIAQTKNKVKKPRMGGWRLEAVQHKDDPFAQAAVLARVERLMYFSGPAPGLVQKPIYIRYDEKRCQVWQVNIPSGLQAYAYLVQVAPDLLALAYFSGSFNSGDLASVEIQLEHFRIHPGAAPAEEGTLLLSTLQRLAKAPAASIDDTGQLTEKIE
jgi:hypothetical protein